MKTNFEVSQKEETSVLLRFEEGLKEAKMMQEGKLPKKSLSELYENC